MSGIYDLTLPSSGSQAIPATGSYVKVLTAPQGAVQVKLDGGEGYSLLAGQGVRLPDGKSFRDVQVKNLVSSAQGVTLFVGDSRFEDTRISGIVSITNQLGANVVGSNGSISTALTAGFADQMLAPASNPRGWVFRRVSVTLNGATGCTWQTRIIAAPSIPTQQIPASSYQLSGALAVGATTGSGSKEDLNILLPAGWGIWAFSIITGSGGATGFWELWGEPQ